MSSTESKPKSNSSISTKPSKNSNEAKSARFISQGLEDLEALIGDDCQNKHFDILIIGSGYGGAMAAAEFAGCRPTGSKSQAAIRVGLLERGEEYLPGMFPKDESEMPGHVRFSTPGSKAPRGNRHGLFDLRLNGHCSTLVANGLGGGSLINAGVMAQPKPDVFEQGWPCEIRRAAKSGELEAYYQAAKNLVGAKRAHLNSSDDNTIEHHQRHQAKPLSKYISLKHLSTGDEQAVFRSAPITVSMQTHPNQAGVELEECKLCGDCASGCNFNAKDSLDTNLLVQAKRQGAEIYTGASVLKLEPLQSKNDSNPEWQIYVNYTDKRLAKTLKNPIKLTAKRVIIAAGSLGSSELLMRSRSTSLPLSHQLGGRFSSNGDMIAVTYHQTNPADAVANEAERPSERKVGPTITGMIDCRDHLKRPLVIEEMAVPAALSRLFSETVTTLNTLYELGEADNDKHTSTWQQHDPLSVDPLKIKHSSLYAIMGDDGAAGSLFLPNDIAEDAEGLVGIAWDELRNHGLFSYQIETLENLSKRSQNGGRVLANGLWQPLTANMMNYLGGENGPLFTVHPLGGCAMADTIKEGVVNHMGQVFKPCAGQADEVYDTLVVLDGSIMPTSLGINPALSIAALALRACKELRGSWELEKPASQQGSDTYTKRPSYRNTDYASEASDTEINVCERLSGTIQIDGHTLIAELTLYFDAKPVNDMCKPFSLSLHQNPNSEPELSNKPRFTSKIRIFTPCAHQKVQKLYRSPEQFESQLDEAACLIAPLTGDLAVFHREASHPLTRKVKGSLSFLKNRGLRDSYQAIEAFAKRFFSGETSAGNNSNPFKNMWNLASHAGEVRLFEYDLEIGQPTKIDEKTKLALHMANILNSSTRSGAKRIKGYKRFTYSVASNPWRQMSEMTVEQFPGMRVNINAKPKDLPVLALDTKFLAREGIPLVQINQQANHAKALYELISLGLYITRIVLTIHTWSFRLPDSPYQKIPERFPGRMKGLPEPVIHNIPVDRDECGQQVSIRLTRYPHYQSDAPAILMIHGYSVSGNTFMHPKVKPNLASYFWDQGRDIWIVDLRTSSAMNSAKQAWSFEDVAMADLPVAIDYVYEHTHHKKIDVLAHCMGAAMFSMAVLSASQPLPSDFKNRLLKRTELRKLRRSLPDKIHKAAFSQVGPTPVFSPANIFRGYLMNYYIHFIKSQNYSFQRSSKPSMAENLFDRLLYSMPYPDEEFALENPIWPWAKRRFVATRHRMDALYGRDFNLANIEPKLYNYFDDLFGPLSLGTVSQVLHFSQHSLITNHKGHNDYVHRENFVKHWRFPSLSFHGEDNGLVDPLTADRMEEILRVDAGRSHRSIIIENHGHQDCLIGKDRVEKVYDEIAAFFNEAPSESMPKSKASTEQLTNDKQIETALNDNDLNGKLSAHLPFIGPVLSKHHEGKRTMFGAQSGPIHTQPAFIMHIPVKIVDGIVTPVDEKQSLSAQSYYSFTHEAFVKSISKNERPTWYRFPLSTSTITINADAILSVFLSPDSDALSNINFPTKGDGIFEDEENLHTLEIMLAYLKGSETTKNKGSAIHALAEPGAFETALNESLTRLLEQEQKSLLKQLISLDKIEPNRSSRRRSSKPANVTKIAVASCQYPAGLLDRQPATASLKQLHKQHIKHGPLDALLLLGDQIYADASAGLFDPTTRFERYVKPTQRFMQIEPLREIVKEVPLHLMLDDHEIEENFSPSDQTDETRLEAINAFLEFQRQHRMPDAKCEKLHYSAMLSDSEIALFMANTRANRETRNARTISQASIMSYEDESDEQFNDLKKFLNQNRQSKQPVFLASPSAVVPRRLSSANQRNGQVASALQSDAWDGYPASLHRLLALIYELQVNNLVLLSGDHHISSATEIRIKRTGSDHELVVHSIHSSGLYSPYPFANDYAEAFASEDHWRFSSPIEPTEDQSSTDQTENGTGKSDSPAPVYECSTSTTFYPGDGYAWLEIKLSQNDWQLDCHFEKADKKNRASIYKIEGKTKH